MVAMDTVSMEDTVMEVMEVMVMAVMDTEDMVVMGKFVIFL